MIEKSGYDIAVIGMSGKFPKAKDIEQFWDNLRDGVNCISFLSDEELRRHGIEEETLKNPNYVRAAPILADVEAFDASFFGLTPREADMMDPQQRVFLECCWQAVENAGYNPTTLGNAGVFAGSRMNTYLHNIVSHSELLKTAGTFGIGLGNDLGFLTTRVSHALNFRGPAVSVHTACSTSLVAVHLACKSLLSRECRVALAGGVAVNVPHITGYLYEEGSIQSPDGFCRVFDANANGTVFGSGVGVIVLKRAEDAAADGDSVLALIQGSAINNDGSNKVSFTAPSVHGQVEVLEGALRASGFSAESVSYVECHGTGTLLGDAIEARALGRVFSTLGCRCALGSVKTNIGHTDAAAGVAGLIKVILSLKHRLLPPNLHFRDSNPHITFSEQRLYVNTSLSPWRSEFGKLRAGVSSFGVGGTNAHVLLEEAPEQPETEGAERFHLLPLSARTDVALKHLVRNLLQHLQSTPKQDFADIAFTLQVGRQEFDVRTALVAANHEEAIQALQSYQVKGPQFGESSIRPAEVIFLFPGQGTEYAAMGRDLYLNEPIFRMHFDQCADIVRETTGLDVTKSWREETSPPGAKASERKQPLTQVAIVILEYCLSRLWMSWGVQPSALLGHSLGEFTAAILSGVMPLKDGLALICARDSLMQDTTPGAMISVISPQRELISLIEDDLDISAENAPDLFTVSGNLQAVTDFEGKLKRERIPHQRLTTSRAFHSRHMGPIVSRFLERVADVALRPPAIPIMSSRTGEWLTAEQAVQANHWAEQMRNAVRFDRAISQVLDVPGAILLEVGPSQSLRHIVLRHPKSSNARLVLSSLPNTPSSSETKCLLSALGRLWEAHTFVQWPSLHPHEGRKRVPLPTYPFDRKIHWIGPAAGETSKSRFGQHRKLSDVGSWFWVPSWRRSHQNQLGKRLNTEKKRRIWLVFAGSEKLGPTLLRALGEENECVVWIDQADYYSRPKPNAFTLSPSRKADYAALLDDVGAGENVEVHALHLWLIDQALLTSNKTDRYTELQRRGVYSLTAFIQALSGRRNPTRTFLHVVTRDGALVESGDKLLPEVGGLISFCTVAEQENEWLSANVIDISSEDLLLDSNRLGALILNEALRPNADRFIAYRGGQRWVRGFERVSLEPNETPVRTLVRGGTYLFTGGLGSVPLLIAKWLASTMNANIVITSRTTSDSSGQQTSLEDGAADRVAKKVDAIQALREAGVEVELIEADAAKQIDMEAAVSRCFERFGRLDGVFHGAGVTSGSSIFSLISDLTPEAYAVQATPKVGGMEVLQRVLAGREVPFVLALSSNAAVLGGLGFGAYAAANAFMDAFALQQASNSGPTAWISANWDHWPIETKRLTNLRTSLDEYAMSVQEALDATDRIIRGFERGQVIVSTGDLPQRCQTWLSSNLGKDRDVTSAELTGRRCRPVLRTPFVEPQNRLQAEVAVIWQEFFGFDRVGINDDFFELGGHSLLAIQLSTELKSRLGRELPFTKLFEGPTIAQIAEALAEVAPETGS